MAATSRADGVAVAFPLAFANACLKVIAGGKYSTNATYNGGPCVDSWNTTTVYLNTYDTIGITFIAIGY